MNWYIKKTIEMYKRGGIKTLLLSGTKYTLLECSKVLLKLSDSVPITIYQSKLLEKNNIFKDIHKNCRCFIVGNGPSLRKHNLTFLNNEITFTVNSFWKHPIVKEWHPTYYCLADPGLFDRSDAMNDFFYKLSSKIKNSTFFVPHYNKKLIEKRKLLPISKTFFIAFRNELSMAVPSEIDLTCYLPKIINVVQLAIMIALYMGCAPIYLIGLDHDWLSHRSRGRHFYTEKTVNKNKKISENLSNESYKITIERVLKLWQGYENLSRYSTKRNIEIMNASKGGFLDIFKRIDYDSIFNKKGTHCL